jgi:MerR HTH family regulatory protein
MGESATPHMRYCRIEIPQGSGVFAWNTTQKPGVSPARRRGRGKYFRIFLLTIHFCHLQFTKYKVLNVGRGGEQGFGKLFSKGGFSGSGCMKGETSVAGPFRKLYRIGEIMRYTELSRQTIHNYTVLGLIAEVERTASNQRLYGEETFQHLERISILKGQGKTLREIRELIDLECASRAAGGKE